MELMWVFKKLKDNHKHEEGMMIKRIEWFLKSHEVAFQIQPKDGQAVWQVKASESIVAFSLIFGLKNKYTKNIRSIMTVEWQDFHTLWDQPPKELVSCNTITASSSDPLNLNKDAVTLTDTLLAQKTDGSSAKRPRTNNEASSSSVVSVGHSSDISVCHVQIEELMIKISKITAETSTLRLDLAQAQKRISELQARARKSESEHSKMMHEIHAILEKHHSWEEEEGSASW
jgi:uncharacterized protein YfcZ (UPF0381/DUF406 family)